MADGPVRKTFPAGHILIRQGEVGDRAWLIESGSLEVMLISPDTGKGKRLSVIGHGAMVGEMALIDEGRRSASVRAVTEVQALELSRAIFERMIKQCTPLSMYLLKTLVAAIRGLYRLPIPPLAEAELADIRSDRHSHKILERKMFPCDHVFFSEGDPGRSAYLIQRGAVAIRKGDKELIRLGAGRLFGELALFSNNPRGATAVALDPTACELIHKEGFDQAMASMPPILRAMARIYVEQLTSGGSK